MISFADTQNLNEAQLLSVKSTEGPLLILAGAGTGKTKVLITRIANIIVNSLARPDEILALTFTNKAAKEMKDRLMAMGIETAGLWIGTFHSICVRILRMHYQAAGLQENFVIIDESEKNKIIKQVALELQIDEKRYPPKLLAFIISSLKEKGISYLDEDKVLSYKYKDLDIVAFYKAFQQKLQFFNVIDFDDIILYAVVVLQKNEKILNDMQTKFKYVLIDEYQDTGFSQNTLVRLLSQKSQNICCVGDEDQSIYGWRGADVTHILNFQKHFPNAKIIRLEQNYRSKGNILDVAMSVIDNNKSRYGKKLITNLGQGDKVKIYKVYDGHQEVNAIIKQINEAIDKSFEYRQIAILVRASYQMRTIEEGLTRNTIPYTIVDGIKFYDRKEIKDLICYIRCVYSDTDQPAFERIINTPKRGFGEKTIEGIIKYSNSSYKSIINAFKQLTDEEKFSDKLLKEAKDFLSNLTYWRGLLGNEEVNLSTLMETIATQSGYVSMLEAEAKEDTSLRYKLENIKEFIASLSQFNSIDEFLEHIALFNSKNQGDNEDSVQILTMHAAKGLEFDVVFLPGMEEGVFPSSKTVEERGEEGLEEERRLCYVAITRAKKNLHIFCAKTRVVFGKWQENAKSRFIKEIEERTTSDNVEIVNLIEASNNFKSDAMSYFNKQGKTQAAEFKKTLNEPESHEVEKTFKKFTTNQEVVHPQFGKGKVTSAIGGFYEVVFEDGLKRLINSDFLNKA